MAKKFRVNFCMTYTVKADDDDDALTKATDMFVDDLPTFKARHFGSNVDEVED